MSQVCLCSERFLNFVRQITPWTCLSEENLEFLGHLYWRYPDRSDSFWLGCTVLVLTPMTPKTLCDQLASCSDHRTVIETSVKNQNSSSDIWSSTGHQKLVNNDFIGKNYHKSLLANGNSCATYIVRHLPQNLKSFQSLKSEREEFSSWN